MTVNDLRRRERAAILVLASLVLAAFPSVVAAHAALDVATPPDGAVVEGTPPEVSGTFTQDLEVDGSSLQLRDANGEVIATGGVDPDDVRRMVIADLPELAPGEYEVRWTTLSAEDGELDRDTWTFTVTAAPTPATPAPTASPTPSPTPTASPATSASPTPAASAATAGPSPSPDETDDPAAGDTDILIPIVAALALVAAAALVLIRRRGPSSPSA